jgi:hypothetical protein
MRKAATKIQATFRMYRARKLLHKKLESVALLQVRLFNNCLQSCHFQLFVAHLSAFARFLSTGLLPHGQGANQVQEVQEGNRHLPEVHSSLEGTSLLTWVV